MGSVIQEGCKIETESFIAAGAVLPAKTIVKSGELWAGVPARKLRDLTAEQRERLHYQANEVSNRSLLACSECIVGSCHSIILIFLNTGKCTT
jgi:carbonic anhydrase/acetyltransferase-like protein (isoleucine patch superfamily)